MQLQILTLAEVRQLRDALHKGDADPAKLDAALAQLEAMLGGLNSSDHSNEERPRGHMNWAE